MTPSSDPPPPRPRWAQSLLKWLKRLVLVALLASLAAFAAAFAIVRKVEAGLPNVHQLKQNYKPAQVTRILARDGSTLAEVFVERRTLVPIKSLPAHVKLAFLAAEDAGFYEHEGLNYLGILRALIVNLKAGRKRQGGSTITQQVVKNILLTSKKTYERKFKEALLARKLEQELGKDEILELYLNHIYFGGGRYGIEEAAHYYFGKRATDLSIADAAMLASLPAGPELFSPRKHLTRALRRRRFVLGQMVKKGFLDAARAEAANLSGVHLAPKPPSSTGVAPEAVAEAKRTLRKLVGPGYKRGGYTVYTTIDPELQRHARESVRKNLHALDKRMGIRGGYAKRPKLKKRRRRRWRPKPEKFKAFTGWPSAKDIAHTLGGTVTGADDDKGIINVDVGDVKGYLKEKDYQRYNPESLKPSQFAPKGTVLPVRFVDRPDLSQPDESSKRSRLHLQLEAGAESALIAIDSRSREVLAMVGNYAGQAGALNRAMHMRRQPGSTFKPFVYGHGIVTRKITPASILDAGVRVRYLYSKNYQPMPEPISPIRMREGLARSLNPVALQVMHMVGPRNVVGFARKMGFESKLGADLSLALGSYEVKPVEMAGAYATFASGGLYQKPLLIRRITGPDGKDLALLTRPPPVRVVSEQEAYLITNLLSSVVDHGTGRGAKRVGRPVVGKTGTTNKAKDAWFVGYSTDIVCAVWTGHDDARPLRKGREQGATAALPAWVSFMKAAHRSRPVVGFPRPAGLRVVRIDPASGKRAYSGQEDAMDELFLPGTDPTEVADDPAEEEKKEEEERGTDPTEPPTEAPPKASASASAKATETTPPPATSL